LPFALPLPIPTLPLPLPLPLPTENAKACELTKPVSRAAQIIVFTLDMENSSKIKIAATIPPDDPIVVRGNPSRQVVRSGIDNPDGSSQKGLVLPEPIAIANSTDRKSFALRTPTRSIDRELCDTG
jgi:hypothetical protein